MVRFFNTLQAAVLFLAASARTNLEGCLDDISPTDSAASCQRINTSDLVSQINILSTRASSHSIEVRQASCPNPSTNSLCPSNSCFIYQENNDGTAWATCCPAGLSLELNSAVWETQKCVSNGVSEAPSKPVGCGGSINANVGTFSGWGCVYSNQIVNRVGRLEQSHLLFDALSLAWFGVWFF